LVTNEIDYGYVLVLSVISLALATLSLERFSLDNAAGLDITTWAEEGIALGGAVAAAIGMLAAL
jgi:putative oxidoreductase